MQEERQRALRNGLECINYEIEAAARKNVAIWFPMGTQNERVLRVTAKEAVLLNSRDKVRLFEQHGTKGRMFARPCLAARFVLASNTICASV